MKILMMSRQNSFHINSYEDLKKVKKQLKLDIVAQEEAFGNNPIFKISSSLFKGASFKSSLNTSMESISLENYKRIAENLLSTVLMANKKTRKFFIAFIIAKEMIPFTIQKINEVMKN